MDFLVLLQAKARSDINEFGTARPLINNQFDFSENHLAFSAYSPEGMARSSRMTYGILSDVIAGVIELVNTDFPARELYFKVENGPQDTFVGYGHLMLLRRMGSTETS